MAFINVKNGTVGRPLGSKGFNLVESFTKKDGTTGSSYFKVWTDEVFAEGTTLDVSGLLSVTAEIYEGAAKSSVSINSPKITPAQTAAPVADNSPF